jgi:phage/plasmid-like protein (TIGR03299 family)
MEHYNKVGLPWSGKMGICVSDCTTAQEVIEKAGLNWQVEKAELVAKMPFTIGGNNKVDNEAFVYKGKIYRECENNFATYRTDYNMPLGIVKSKYEVVQNRDAFSFFNEVIGDNRAKWEYAGQFGYGQQIFVVAKIENTINVGKHDPIDSYLVFSNSHDGTGSVNILFTPVRVFCLNMMRGAVKSADNYIKLRHTSNVHKRLQLGSEVLNAAIRQCDNVSEIYNALNVMKMTDEEVIKYISNLVLSDAERVALLSYDSKNGYERLLRHNYMTLEATKISTRKANTISSMYKYYHEGIAQQELVGTGYGAYNAITGYYSNVVNLEGERRMDSLLYGGGAKVIGQALDDILRLQKVA